MESHVAEMIEGRAGELAWLLEHPPLYTAGSTAKPDDLLEPTRFPVHRTGRGGEYTYHGPGQRVCYVMLDLNRRGRDVRSGAGEVRGLGLHPCQEFAETTQIADGGHERVAFLPCLGKQLFGSFGQAVRFRGFPVGRCGHVEDRLEFVVELLAPGEQLGRS